ncbi:UV radiation resistance protein and autophagy-related subunit 14-domain-containing protein [Lentinula edodes]|nr:UV radiation resistance protein and autophagy-related subunit 14-domain-containing protein [Lentinula edodes]
MECQNCQLQQRAFFCDDCVKKYLRDYRQQTSHFSLERNAAVAKATSALTGSDKSGSTGMETARIRRANVSSLERRVSELMDGLTALRKDNERKRERLQMLRAKIAERRQTLTAAKTISVSPTASVSSVVISAHASLASLSSSIAHARTGLVQELVEVFGISHDDTHWIISNLILPVPGDMRRYPPDHLNAVMTSTIHFVNLLAFYLGVKLPFHVTWTKGKLGVGVPHIGAVKGIGGDAGGWARWHQKHPLHVSASSSASPPAPTSSSPFTSIALPESTSSSSSDTGSPSASTADSMVFDSQSGIDPAIMQNQLITSSFTTGIAMLLYNVAYLAYTQHGVNIPLNQVASGELLGNLWGICFGFSNGSGILGRYSHETASSLIPNPCTFPLNRLPPPTPPSFTLEFGQLLQAMSRPTPKSTLAQAQGINPVSVPISASSHSTFNSKTTSEFDSLSLTRPRRKEKATRRASEVSLTKNIVKSVKNVEMSPFREDDHEEGEGGRHDEEEWDLV